MARIATCYGCGIEFWDDQRSRDCPRCAAHRKRKAEKLAKWKRIIDADKNAGQFKAVVHYRIIGMHWRDGLRVHEIAKVTEMTEKQVEFAIDIIKQDAR